MPKAVPGHSERQPLPFFLHFLVLRICSTQLQCPVLTLKKNNHNQWHYTNHTAQVFRVCLRNEGPHGNTVNFLTCDPRCKRDQNQKFLRGLLCSGKVPHLRLTWPSSCQPSAFLSCATQLDETESRSSSMLLVAVAWGTPPAMKCYRNPSKQIEKSMTIAHSHSSEITWNKLKVHFPLDVPPCPCLWPNASVPTHHGHSSSFM